MEKYNGICRVCASEERKEEMPQKEEKQEEGERVLRCTLQPLREVWMEIGIEKVGTHERVTMKALLDSGATRMFIDKRFVEKNGFKLEKLNRPIKVMNIDETDNKGGMITHEVECNVYYKGHMERMQLDVCNLGRTEVILGMLEIDWEKGEVKMTRCPPFCGKREKDRKILERKEIVRKRETRKIEEEKTINWVVDEKEDWGRKEEMEVNHHKIEAIVPKRFHQWLKVFGKMESERMPVRKVWDHAIDLKENFKASKAKVYLLSRKKRD